MKVTIEGKDLVVRIPMQKGKPSKSGKTLVVATTHGNVETDAKVNGKKIKLGLNAYIPNDEKDSEDDDE